MSALCMVEFSSQKLRFAELNALANEIMADALLNNYAVFFNDDYAQQILDLKARRHTILISRSFFDRNADELFDVTDIVRETEKRFKEEFLNRFSFFNQILDVLFRYQLEHIDIYFTDYSESNLDEYIKLKTNKKNMLSDLYAIFIQKVDETGFSFPNIKLCVSKV